MKNLYYLKNFLMNVIKKTDLMIIMIGLRLDLLLKIDSGKMGLNYLIIFQQKGLNMRVSLK